ncbi:RHS repeat protein [Dactylosporangium roseum]|uniref:RHS repeat protein n=1 Tax=Dactylosporangium roseum TaxID=47989 RepID=A0ABY5ZGX9_9ACTN|nr:RHS repeat-associated core domain-containing protein [Dactylosporangium roseum]UWZ39978.1 RHS repeat protein [Dactylosporangium roseum]
MNTVDARVVSVDAVPVAGDPAVGLAGESAVPTVFALTAAVSSPVAGNFAATSLSAAYGWAQGGSSGSFSYDYPIVVPEGLGGPVPEVALGYSSGSVDGRTSGANGQPSWLGDGWDYQPGYIERSYRSCLDDGQSIQDLCYFSRWNATMVWGGKSTALVADTEGGTGWHAADDSGLRVEQLYGASNYTADGQYWRVTTQDGTQYYFGAGKRYAADPSNTLSTAVEPVFGDDPGDDCHRSTLATSWCNLGYRWNLDYVVDPRGNSMTYFYSKYTGAYGLNNGAVIAPYDITVTLDRIEYGTRAGSEGSSSAPMQVVFGTSNRCTPSAANCTAWPDVPWDTYCSPAWASCAQRTPTYWTPSKLDTITTKVWSTADGAYRDVDRWDMTYTFPSYDGVNSVLWLNNVQHTGLVGGSLAEPAMTFVGTALKNRVFGSEPMWRFRLSGIDTGTGRQQVVTYEGSGCTQALLSTFNWRYNPYRCYPSWNGTSYDWYEKYAFSWIRDIDLLGGGPEVWTFYGYSNDGSVNQLWAYDTNEMVPPEHRNWSKYVGYSTVTVKQGPDDAHSSRVKTLYYRGLHDDGFEADGTHYTVNVTDSQAVATADQRALAGMVRERTTLDGTTPLDSTITDYTVTQTAKRVTTIPSGTITAYRTTTANTKQRTYLAATSSWRWTRTEYAYNSDGLVTQVNDLGETGTATGNTPTSDDTCTTITYTTPDTTKWFKNYPAQTVTTDCAANPTGGNYLAGSQTFYDGATTLGATPTKGLVTKTTALASVSGTTLSWVQAGRTGYDTYGRVTDTYDRLDQHSSTAYTPAANYPVTQTTVTNPLGHSTTTTYDPLRGLPTAILDLNNKTTSMQYDPLGRLTKVFKPHTSPTTSLPDIEYTYTLRSTGGPNSVTTKVLGPNGNQVTSYQLYDGLLRARQTQAPAAQANGGRIITDTQYDGRGLTVKTTTFWNSSPPAAEVVGFADTDAAVNNQHRYTYDALDRQTVDALYSANTLKWQTTTAYDGNLTTVTPPDGGTPTTTYVNGRGKPTELRQYLASTPTGSYHATTYKYDRLDRLTEVKDQSNNTWTTHYNLLGLADSTTDPDKGTTTTVYDGAGRPQTVTNANNASLTYTYDALGRRTGLYDGTTTSGFQRAKWIYDTATNGKGQLTSSTRYVTGTSGTDAYTTTVTGYDDGYRPLGTTTVIPSSLNLPGLPSGSYTTSTTYNVDGSVATITYPAAGGLSAETVTSTYDNTGRPLTLTSPDATYVASTSYYGWGVPYQQINGTGTKRVRQTTAMDEATGRLTTSKAETENQSTPNAWVEQLTQNYGYDQAGNVKNITETSAGATVSNECFLYNKLRELTEAWTTTAATCQTAPATANVGGPDAYWTSYTYATGTGNYNSGNRTTEVRHAIGGGTDTTRTYAYPTTGKRHTLTSVTATGGATGTDNYAYDAAGNMTTRNITGKPGQTLTWDSEGHLATLTDSGGTTSYIYDADGNRLVAKDPAGVTVYLPGYELRKVGSTTTCTRYYGSVASRTPAGLTWIASDHHGTGQLAIDANTLTTTRRKSDPFGNPRGTDPTWPNTRGFVDGTRDNTGLTHLGAREYEPTTGRFTSDDLITDFIDPQQINGYAYANNAPTTSSDPTGLWNDHDPRDTPAWEWPCSLQHTENCGAPHYGNGGTDPRKVKRPSTSPNCMVMPQGCEKPPVVVPSGKPPKSKDGSAGKTKGNWPLIERNELAPDGCGYLHCSDEPVVKCVSWLNWACQSAEWIDKYVQIGASACFMYCLGVSYQDGTVGLTTAAGVGLGFTGTIGLTSAKPADQGPVGWLLCMGDGPGGCYIGGVKGDVGADMNGHSDTWHGGAIGAGVGFYGGGTWTPFTWQIGPHMPKWHPFPGF